MPQAQNPIDGEPTGSPGPRRAVPIPSDAKWISAKQVCARYGGRSIMWLTRKLENDPNFPRPTFFGSLRYWQPVELDAYDETIIRKSLADRDARALAKTNSENNEAA